MLDNLIKVLDKIRTEIELPVYLDEICHLIIGGVHSHEQIDEIIKGYKINPGVAKIEFLHLIFAYIKIALEDDVLTDEEKNDIKFLKVLFRIQPGEFLYHNIFDVEETIRYHLAKIYKDDFVTEDEAELKDGLQEIFDLSFDEMNDYAKSKAAQAIRRGTDVKDLDVVFIYDEYFKLRSGLSSWNV
ncbi:MAG: hypothetical protein ACTHK8_10665 [Ginsengibacter sp.]